MSNKSNWYMVTVHLPDDKHPRLWETVKTAMRELGFGDVIDAKTKTPLSTNTRAIYVGASEHEATNLPAAINADLQYRGYLGYQLK